MTKNAAKKDEPAKRPRGRPQLPPEEQMVVGSIRLKRAHWAKLDAIGGVARMRRWLDKVKE